MKALATTLLLTCLASLAVACGPPADALTPAAGGPKQDDPAAKAAAFMNLEDDVLRELAAADRRVGLRGHLQPREEDLRRVTMGALLAEDPTLAAIDGAIDPFSFEARARGVAAIKAKLAFAPAGLTGVAALEEELLARLVDEEILRLDEERALPRSASALVRGIVDTWTAPLSPQQAGERDRWLARRLGEVRLAIDKAGAPGGAGALDVGRARELDDALDAMERAIEAAGLGKATGELVLLREALEARATMPAAAAASTWAEVDRGMHAHLGIVLPPETLDARFNAEEKRMRVAAEAAIANLHLRGDELGAHAATLVYGASGTALSCAVKIPSSRVRSMAPPSERAAACRLRQAALGANDERARAYVLVAIHDHMVVAQWALDVARGSATIAQAVGRHRPLSQPGPDVAARWERLAVAQPTTAIGGGLGAGILYELEDVVARAQAWAELGEVPFDIAERELQQVGLRPSASPRHWAHLGEMTVIRR